MEKVRSGRTEINFNTDWVYKQGDCPDAEGIKLHTEGWSDINLPHNTTLYSYTNTNAYQGISWYRKTFFVKASLQGKKITLVFEGVMQSCIIFINGMEVSCHKGGYTPFVIDLTNHLKYNSDNVLAIKVDSRAYPEFVPGKAGVDFQYFGGIYRNVTMLITNPVYLSNAVYENITAGGGVFITAPVVEKAVVKLKLKLHVKNETVDDKKIFIKTELLYGESVVASTEDNQIIAADSSDTLLQMLTIADPVLWHPNTPRLYKVRIAIRDEADLLDLYEFNYGIRKIEWKHDGLFINGDRLEAPGVNLHSDIFVLGNAIPDNEVYEEIRRLKEYGFDFIRMSHYPHSQAYYDACDFYGVLVLDCMSGWQNFSTSEQFQNSTFQELHTMIQNSRNHPCIVAWETSLNESNYTEAWAKEVHAIAHQEYPTDGVSRMWTTGWRTDVFDIALGAAQHGIRDDGDLTDKGVIISEYGDWDYGGSLSTSRVTRYPAASEHEGGDKGMLIQAGNIMESVILTRNKSWYSADAYWCYQDYAGFDSMTNCGIVDTYRLPKYGAYFYKSQRDADVDLSEINIDSGAMVYIANSWTSASPSTVMIFSNCDEVELFLNGDSMGRHKPDESIEGNNTKTCLSTKSLKHPPFSFHLSGYIPGELKAVGYIKGKAVASTTVKSPGVRKAITLRQSSTIPLSLNGSAVRLVWISVIDDNGTVVTNADVPIEIEVENGYTIGYETVVTKGGQTGIWIRGNRCDCDRTITVTARSAGMDPASLVIQGKGIDKAVSGSSDKNEYRGSKEIHDQAGTATGYHSANVLAAADENTKNEGASSSLLTDIAREKKAYASSAQAGCSASDANDGNPGRFWYPDNMDECWWYVDCERAYHLSSIEISWNSDEIHKYLLEGSLDGQNWVTLKDQSDSIKPDIQTKDLVAGTARFIRIHIKKTDQLQGINMFYVYGN